MNPNTRVSIHCFAGDGNHARDALPQHLRHECPITILSPDDSPVTIEHPNVDNRHIGKRQSAGQLSLERQREQMRTLLSYPENYFLMNDADSMCLSAKIPDYLYAEGDVLWSNLVYDPMPKQQQGYSSQYYPEGFPRLAFQPPYFLSRRTIERLLAVSEGVTANPVMPYIDHYMVQLAVRARIVWKGFPDGISAPLCTSPGHMQLAQTAVRHRGVVFVHSVKAQRYWEPLVRAHQGWLSDYRATGDETPIADIRTTDPMQPVELVSFAWNGNRTILTYSTQDRATLQPGIGVTRGPNQSRDQYLKEMQRRGLKA